MDIKNRESNTNILEKLDVFFQTNSYKKFDIESTHMKIYGRYARNILYIISVIKFEASNIYEEKKYEGYKEIVKDRFKTEAAEKTVLLNIFLIDNEEKILENVNYHPDIDAEFVDISWIINTNNQKLIIPEKQISNVLDLNKNIKDVLSGEYKNRFKIKQIKKVSYISIALIIMNVIMWLITEVDGGSTSINTLLKYGASSPEYVFKYKEYYRLFTSIFLHVGLLHLVSNMFSLYIFGTRLEKYVSNISFLIIYIFSGIFGSILSVGVSYYSNTNIVMAGASGSIYGILGSMIYFSMKSKSAIGDLSSYILWLIVVINIGLSVIVPGISVLAHLGGFLGGMILSMVVRKVEFNETR